MRFGFGLCLAGIARPVAEASVTRQGRLDGDARFSGGVAISEVQIELGKVASVLHRDSVCGGDFGGEKFYILDCDVRFVVFHFVG
jgi:hypothetical protein